MFRTECGQKSVDMAESANVEVTNNNNATLVCLKHVSALKDTIFAKRLATTQKGRRAVTKIYQKFKFAKDDPAKENKRKSRLKYDKDGRGDAKFLEALLLMLKEGYNSNSAAKKVVGPDNQNAFRISLGTCNV